MCVCVCVCVCVLECLEVIPYNNNDRKFLIGGHQKIILACYGWDDMSNTLSHN